MSKSPKRVLGRTLNSTVPRLKSTTSITSLEQIGKHYHIHTGPQRPRKFLNFVPWQVHRQVLLLCVLAILPLIASFSIMAILRPMCLSPTAFWPLNLGLTFQVSRYIFTQGGPLMTLLFCIQKKWIH